MKYNPEKHHRRSVRLPKYDYSQPGGYFVTIVTKDRACLFGKIVDGKMVLNEYGLIAKTVWNDLPNHYNITLDEYVIMPNHIHGIIIINDIVGAIHESPLRMDIKQRRKMMLPKIIGRFKTSSSKKINVLRKTPGQHLWQRNYWEHVIRNENELNRIREYIINNPLQWAMDYDNPALAVHTSVENENGK